MAESSLRDLFLDKKGKFPHSIPAKNTDTDLNSIGMQIPREKGVSAQFYIGSAVYIILHTKGTREECVGQEIDGC
jgi:hypothetical protein